jgi:glycosyltransferase involved in cell wall biosynthesis
MRVLHVIGSLDQRTGGPLRALLDLSAQGRKYGINSDLLGFGQVRIDDNPLPSGSLHCLPIVFPKSYVYSRELRTWLGAHLSSYDGVVIHGMWLYPGWAVARACLSLGIPYACFPHGMFEPWSVFRQGLVKAIKKSAYWFWRERAIFQHAERLFFTTPREMELAGTTFHMGDAGCIVIPYGIHAARRRVEAPERADLLQPPGTKVCLFLGRVHPHKNLEFLLTAWAEAHPPADWRLLVAGPGDRPYLRRLERLIIRQHLQSQVLLLGQVTGADKAYLLQRASWFVLPSQHENFGVAVLEAIGNGCPVVVSNQVYLSDSFHPRSEILPLRLDDWVRFFRDRMPDQAHRDELVELDQKFLLPIFEIDAVARAWASTLAKVFSRERVIEHPQGSGRCN